MLFCLSDIAIWISYAYQCTINFPENNHLIMSFNHLMTKVIHCRPGLIGMTLWRNRIWWWLFTTAVGLGDDRWRSGNVTYLHADTDVALQHNCQPTVDTHHHRNPWCSYTCIHWGKVHTTLGSKNTYNWPIFTKWDCPLSTTHKKYKVKGMQLWLQLLLKDKSWL